MPNKNLKDGPKEAIRLVQEITKQILTLTSAVLVLSATFVKILIGESPSLIFILISAWILLTFSIIGGILTLSSLVYQIKENKYEPFAKCTTIPAGVQWICFVMGFLLLWIFVGININ